MIVEIINTDWFLGENPPEGTVTFKAINGNFIDAFSYGEEFPVGETIEIELTFLDAPINWEVRFSENTKKEKRLVKVDTWAYEAYGQIKSISPVVVDFGDIELETGYWTSDVRVIGEYVYLKIDRLDIIKSE